MIDAVYGWRSLAILVSLLVHAWLIVEWSDRRIEQAAQDQPFIEPIVVHLNFPQPQPEVIPQIVQSPKPVVEKVIEVPKPIPKPIPKPKPRPKPNKPDRKPLIKPLPKADPEPVQESVAQTRSAPPRAVPQANLREQYLARLLARIEAHKHYPKSARRRNIQGKVQVSFSLSCDGRVTDLSIDGSHSVLRKAANKAIQAAVPLPEVPDPISCPMPVKYAMAYTLDN
ncbi:MAG: TonB family protein [Candidatus Thiodiazotropha sp.]